MKIKLFILLILLAECSNEQNVTHYLIMETNYRILSSHADFVITDQQGVLEYGLVSLLDMDTLATREATDEDKRKAIELSYMIPTYKKFCDEAASACKELEKQYKRKNIFQRRDRQIMIELNTTLLNNAESSLMKVTGGLTPEEYIDPFIPKHSRKSLLQAN
jgi:capsid portal protein